MKTEFGNVAQIIVQDDLNSNFQSSSCLSCSENVDKNQILMRKKSSQNCDFLVQPMVRVPTRL